MPSFDVVSQVNMHELTNAIDQANREIANRFDFKGTNSRVEHSENQITLVAPAEFQVKQINDILQNKMSKRKIDVSCLEMGNIVESNNEARQSAQIKQGIDKELAKKITRIVKDSKVKVQSSIQGDQVRITGKKKDDLQDIITLLKNSKIDQPLQFVNFRD